MLEKTLESPLDSKEIKPVNLNGNQPWILIGRTDVKVEAPVFWLPDVNSQLWKSPWWQGLRAQRKRVSEDKMAGWHHQCNGHEVKLLSRVQLFVTPRTVAYQVPPSMGFSRQAYWSGLLFPSLGDLLHTGIKSVSPALQADSLPPSHLGSSDYHWDNWETNKQKESINKKVTFQN